MMDTYHDRHGSSWMRSIPRSWTVHSLLVKKYTDFKYMDGCEQWTGHETLTTIVRHLHLCKKGNPRATKAEIQHVESAL